jgi:hypothetical protein
MKRVALFLSIICFMGFNEVANAQESAGIDQGIRDSVDYFSEIIEPGTKIVVLNIQSESANLSEYSIDELIKYFIEKRKYTIVDRQNLELIQQEMDFQLSGEVSDESAQSIGKKLGAQIIISGSINPFGSNYRLRLRAIGVETAAIHGIQTKTILMDNTLSALLGQPVDTADTRNMRSDAQRDDAERPFTFSFRNDFELSFGANVRTGMRFTKTNVHITDYTSLLEDRSFKKRGYDVGGGLFFDMTYAVIRMDFMYNKVWSVPGPGWDSYGILNFGIFVKYPFKFSKIAFFPLVGVDYEVVHSSYVKPPSIHNALWLRFGAGMDYSITRSMYLRVEGLYGFKFDSEYEKDAHFTYFNGNPVGEVSFRTHGFIINVGVGFKL